MSFLYPRLATFTRATHQGGSGGTKGYGGLDEDARSTIATGVPCNVQATNTAKASPDGLPGATAPGRWNINMPLGAGGLAEGDIRDDDFVEDDLGRRFQISSAYPHSLGWKLICDRLEA